MTRTGRSMMGIQRTLATNLLSVSLLAGATSGCSNLLKNDEVPPGVTDPAITETPAGALAAYQGLLTQFQEAFAGGGARFFVTMAGLLSDELRSGNTLGMNNVDPEDARTLPESPGFGDSYLPFQSAQKVRGQAAQAIGLLTLYVPEQRALIGHTYALEGYAEVMLAELFCSGIPLSTLDFGGDYTYHSGSTTAEVFTHAAALFDTALTLAGDSMRFVHLAAVGKARALLGLGQYAAAAAAAAAVLDDYHYNVYYSAVTSNTGFWANFVRSDGMNLWAYSMADREGGNGLGYITSGDPRTAATLEGTNQSGFLVYRPTQYAPDGSSPIVLASGVEARLIAAEAALQANDPSWLTTLNTLRTDGTFDITATTPPDTLWHAGSGSVAGLGPLADPGTATDRVDLLFRERAFWLFLTGHRQGDLRRLIRQYGRTQDSVYPVGPYPGATGALYGDDVTMPIPNAERVSNPLFTGCISRKA